MRGSAGGQRGPRPRARPDRDRPRSSGGLQQPRAPPRGWTIGTGRVPAVCGKHGFARVAVRCAAHMTPTSIPAVRTLDRLVSRLPRPVEARVRDRLGLDLFMVVAAVVVVLRLFNETPWTPWVLDMHTYWATGAGVSYAHSNPYVIGAYLYAPAFAQVLYPLTTLPWPWFAALW